MTNTIEIRPGFAEALDAEDWDRLEEMWLEELDVTPIPTAELLEVRRLSEETGIYRVLVDVREQTDDLIPA